MKKKAKKQAKASMKAAKKVAAKKPTGRAAKPKGGPAFRRVVPKVMLTHPRAAGSSDTAKLAAEVAGRIKGYDKETARLKTKLEKLALSINKLVSGSASKRPERGPRRFRSGPVKMREIQRDLTEVSLEIRLLSARRVELSWVHELLTGQPAVVAGGGGGI